MSTSRRSSLHLSTFSIVGADPEAGDVGVAVQSKFLAVGAIVPWARGGVGAAAVQAFPDVTVGPRALDLLATGVDPDAVLDELVRADPMAAQRQTGLVAADGRSASHTGAGCFDHKGSVTGPGYAVQGNVLAGPEVLSAMETAFLDHRGPLAHRLLAGLQAGQDAGGEKRGMESAALVVARPGGGYGGNHDRLVDLRVDHHDDPITRLAELLEVRDFYFDRSPPSAWFPLAGEVRDEVSALLRRGGWLEEGAALPSALMDFMGWENLEERWADDDHVDPVVLGHLRKVHG